MARNKIFFNPFTDFGFKKLFGEEGSKELLIDFLNQLLPIEHTIASLAFNNLEGVPDSKEERQAVFDIYCVSTSGERFIVEMQKARNEYFKDRALYYTTFPIREQGKKGKWSFELKPVYLIAVLDFVLPVMKKANKDVKVDVMLKDQHGDPFYNKLHFCFIQMPLFHKKEAQLETHFDKWLFFLKNLENFDHIPAVLNEPVFKQGFEIARLANLEPKERQQYNYYNKKYLDTMNAIETAKKDGIKEGIEKGIKEGMEKGMKKGMEKGMEKGIKEGITDKAIVVASAMIEDQMPIEQIMRYTGLSRIEVQKLMKEGK